jgi:hypothetical protein
VEEETKPLEWRRVDIPDREESMKDLTNEYFGDVIAKLKGLILKDKRKLDKIIKDSKNVD